MSVKVVVTDENGLPVHCTVAAIKTSDQSIIDTYETDAEGKAIVEASGTWYPRPMVAPEYKRRIKVTILNDSNGPCYDAVVDATGGGTHTKLFGTGGALETALQQARGSQYSIWMCNSETVSSTFTLPSATGTSGVITVSIEASEARVNITCPGGSGLMLGSNSNTNVALLRWKNINFIGTGSSDPWATLNAGSSPQELSNEFLRCGWSNGFGALIQQTVLACGPQGHTTLTNCTGTFTYLYQETVSNAQGGPGSWLIRGSSITLTSGLYSLGSGIHPTGNFTVDGDSVITSTGTNFLGAFSLNGMGLTLRHCAINHSGSGNVISKLPATTNVFDDVQFYASGASSRAISSSGASGTNYINAVLAVNSAGSTEYAINITGATVILGAVTQQGYAGAYTGATPSSGLDHGSLSGLSDDDHTQYVLDSALDASIVPYTPSTLSDWTSSTDPGGTDDALDQLASRLTDVEALTTAPDASGVTYTPLDSTDWTTSSDPGNVDDALDQIADRVTTLEGGGGSGGAPDNAQFVVTKSDASLTAEVVRQWLGNFFAETYPASANAMDDEFDDTTGNSGSTNGLNARWSWVNQSTSALDYSTQGWVKLTVPAHTGHQIRGIVQTLPAGDGTWEMLMSTQIDNDLCFFGMWLRDSVGGDSYAFGIAIAAVAAASATMFITKYTNDTTFSSNRASLTAPNRNKFYLRITRSGTTLSWLTSEDGIAWTTFYSETDSVGPDQIGFMLDEQSNKTNVALFVDYFRRIA